MPSDRASHTDEPARPRWRRGLNRLLQALGGVAVLLVTLVLILLLLLQTSWGARTAAHLAADYANPFTNATIQVGHVEGNWVQTLELHNVSLVPAEQSSGMTRFAHIDTLRLRYDLLALLRSTLHVRELTLLSPSASFRQKSDSTWVLPTLPPSDPAPADTTSRFAMQIDAIHVRRGHATARFFSPRGDSTLHVRDLRLGVRDLRYASPLTARLDTLGLEALPPGYAAPLQLQAAGTLTDDRFTLDGLRLTSPHSDVQGEGTLRLAPTPRGVLDDVDFTLTAAPLSFRDVAPFVPTAGLNPDAALRLDVRAQGAGRLLQLHTDAALSTGGTLTLDAAATPVLPTEVERTTPEPLTPEPLRYRLNAQVRNLNTEAFGAPVEPTRVSGDLQVDLEGPALGQLSGTVTTRLFDTQITGYRLQLPRLQLAFANGQAAVSGAGSMAGAAFTVDGSITPFAAAPAYDIRTRLSDLDLGAFVEGSDWSSRLNTQLQLAGTGFAFPGAQLTARLDVLSSVINEQRIDGGRITVRLQRDTLRYDSQITFPEGRVAAAGTARLADPLTYTLEQGRFEALDIAALMGDTTASSLNGSFSLRGQGTAPRAMRLQADAQLQDSYYGDYVLRAASSRLLVQRGRVDLDTDIDMQGGRFELAGIAEPFTEPATLRVTRGRFRDVHLGVILQDSTQYSALNGSFNLRGDGWTADSLGTWTAQVALDTSRINQQPLHAARLDATLRQARIEAALQLDTPAGRTRFAGYARPFDEVPTYTLTEGMLTDLDLGALAGVPSARTALNGTFTLEGRGIDPATVSLDAQLNLDTSTVNRATLERGGLNVRFTEGEGTLTSRFDFDQGRMTLSGSVRPQDDRPSYRLQGQVDSVNAAALAGIDSLASSVSLDIDVEGTGLDPRTLQLTGRVTSHATRYAAVRLDALDARLQMRDGLLQIDTLLAQTNIGTVQGGGQVAVSDPSGRYESDFLVRAQTTDVAPLRSVMGTQQLSLGTGRFEGRVYGTPGTVRFDALATLTNLAYQDLRLGDAEVQLAGARGDTAAVSALEVRGSVGFLSYGTFFFDDLQLNAQYEGSDINFSSTLTIDRERNARLAGTIDPRPGRERLVLETFDARLGANRWTLLQDATITYGEAYRISNLLLYSDQQQLAADGVIDFNGRQSLVVTLESIAIDTFTDLLGYEGLGGRLSGTLAMDGPAQQPQINGSLNLDVRSFEQEVGQLRLGLNYDSLRTRIDALLTHRDNSTLTVRGQVPTDFRLAAQAEDTTGVMNDPIDLSLTAETFSIGWIDPFIDPTLAQNISGQFDADVAVGGTLDTPVLSGSGSIQNGQLDLTELGTTYDRITADLAFDGEQVRVQQAAARSAGGGRLRGQGVIDLADLTLGAYDLAVTTTDFLAINTRDYRARVDSELEVLGSTEQPIVRGSAQVESADIYIETSGAESDLATVGLSEDDWQTIERRFGIRLSEADTTAFDTYEALAMDLSVRLERNTWVRSRANPQMSIQITGNLDVQKEPSEDIQVFGTIEVIPERSRVVQFGKEFQIEEGTLTFNGPAAEPMLDLEATYAVRARASQENEVTITLGVDGRPEDLDFTLSSTPTLDTNNILSYLAVGRPANQLLSGANGGSTGQGLAQRVALGQAAGIIENLAASRLGLDVVRIEPTPDGSVFLTAGQYLSPRFYAAVQQAITDDLDDPVTSSVPDITLEYELTRWLLIRALYRNPNLRLNLFWEYAY